MASTTSDMSPIMSCRFARYREQIDHIQSSWAVGEGITHARFKPHQGRVHLRIIPEESTARIAYIGRKRGI